MYVCTVQCWPKPSILCPGSVMSSMWSLRKMGWATLILSSTPTLPPTMHMVLVLPVDAHFASTHSTDWGFFSLVVGPAVCELLSVGICLLPVRTTLLQQVQTVCVCVNGIVMCVWESEPSSHFSVCSSSILHLASSPRVLVPPKLRGEQRSRGNRHLKKGDILASEPSFSNDSN